MLSNDAPAVSETPRWRAHKISRRRGRTRPGAGHRPWDPQESSPVDAGVPLTLASRPSGGRRGPHGMTLLSEQNGPERRWNGPQQGAHGRGSRHQAGGRGRGSPHARGLLPKLRRRPLRRLRPLLHPGRRRTGAGAVGRGPGGHQVLDRGGDASPAPRPAPHHQRPSSSSTRVERPYPATSRSSYPARRWPRSVGTRTSWCHATAAGSSPGGRSPCCDRALLTRGGGTPARARRSTIWNLGGLAGPVGRAT